jgi:DNA-binding NtrC family response regulator
MLAATALIIEDLEDVSDVLAVVLSLEGYQVMTAMSVPAAEAVRDRVGSTALGVVITNLRLTRLPHSGEGANLINAGMRSSLAYRLF